MHSLRVMLGVVMEQKNEQNDVMMAILPMVMAVQIFVNLNNNKHHKNQNHHRLPLFFNAW